jgi:hypothetical protein
LKSSQSLLNIFPSVVLFHATPEADIDWICNNIISQLDEILGAHCKRLIDNYDAQGISCLLPHVYFPELFV